MSKQRLSVDRLFWASIMAAWSLYIMYLLASRQILMFLHPKMLIFAWGSTIVFALLAIVRFSQAKTPVKKQQFPRPGYLIFLTPLLLVLISGANPLESSAVDARMLKTGGANENLTTIQIGRRLGNLEQLLATTAFDETFVFDDAIFPDAFFDMTENPEKYKGRRIQVLGFVHRTPTLEADQIFVTRLLLTCCAADSDPLGVLASSEAFIDIERSRWITITGIVGITDYENPYTQSIIKLPYIITESIEYDTRPVVPYIYPTENTPIQAPSH